MRRFRASLMVSALLGLSPATLLTQEHGPLHLKDTQTLTAGGRLDIQFRGWQRFLILRLDRPYVPEFGPGEPSKPVTALELNAPGQDLLLSEHVGEAITVAGTVQLDNVSPYFWNGVRLVASSVTLPGGGPLLSQRTQARVPATTEFYAVTIALVPHQFEWRREARDIETGDILPDPAVDGCSLNGGGDVMHCLCVPGFLPVRAGVVPHPLPTTHWREIPPSQFALPGMAQFPLPDPGATHPQLVEVACKRKGLSAK